MDATTPVRWAYSGSTTQTGYEHRRDGSFVLVSISGHVNAPKHWVPASAVSVR